MRTQKILVPTDFSDGSANSLRFACAFARRHGSKLVLLHSLDLPIYYYRTLETQRDDVDELQKHALEQARDKMQGIVDHLPEAKGLEVQVRARVGAAAREIVAETEEEHDIDLVIIATHGRGGLAHALLGSVAEKVIRTSPVPVITVQESYTDHDRLMGPSDGKASHGVLFCTDLGDMDPGDTDLGDAPPCALEPAVDLARTLHAPLTLLHVLEDLAAYPLVNWSYFPDVEATQFYSDAEKHARTELTQLAERHCPPATVDSRVAIQRGNVPVEIAEAAKRLDCDIIVMATHGRTGWTHAILGSVAEKVARIAECPVLTVRFPKEPETP